MKNVHLLLFRTKKSLFYFYHGWIDWMICFLPMCLSRPTDNWLWTYSDLKSDDWCQRAHTALFAQSKWSLSQNSLCLLLRFADSLFFRKYSVRERENFQQGWNPYWWWRSTSCIILLTPWTPSKRLRGSKGSVYKVPERSSWSKMLC